MSEKQTPASTVFRNPGVLEINQKYKTQWALQSAKDLLEWDLEVYLPPAGSSARGTVLAEVSLLMQKQMSDIYPMLDKLLDGDLNNYEKGDARVLRRKRKYFTRIPPSLLERKSKTAAEATVAWRSARRNADFRAFEPYLDKSIEIAREEAEKLGYEKHPYDALLDQYEEGFTVDDADAMYSRLVPELKGILEKIQKQNSRFLEKSQLTTKSYGVPAMSEVNDRLIAMLGMPKDRFRVDISTHPFSQSMSRDDVRITTRYEGNDFKRALFSTIHESGHAIYELQIDEKLEYSPIGTAVSFGFHESQSRFWENVIGRSREFVSLLRPTLIEGLPFVSSFDDDQLYYYFNEVAPGVIRVDADELTYNFHTALRYDIEKKAISGELETSELPEIWNDTLEKYLGIRPANDAEGILQDVHWSHGSFGYFPTYTLGNVIAGMIWHDIRRDLALNERIRTGDFAPIKRWLYEKIHRWGSTFAPKELAVKAFGRSVTPDDLIEYLKAKFIEL